MSPVVVVVVVHIINHLPHALLEERDCERQTFFLFFATFSISSDRLTSVMALLNESSRSWLPHEADHDILLRISRRHIVDDEWGSFVTAVCSTILVVSMVSTFYWVLWKPYSKRRFYEKQGISGPVFRPFIGNLPEIRELRRGVPKLGGQISESPARRVGTELFVFSEKYGKIFDHTTLLLYICINPSSELSCEFEGSHEFNVGQSVSQANN